MERLLTTQPRNHVATIELCLNVFLWTDSFGILRGERSESIGARKQRQQKPRLTRVGLKNLSRSLAQKFLAILCRAGSAHPAEDSCKVLLCFEPARHSDIQNPLLGRA